MFILTHNWIQFRSISFRNTDWFEYVKFTKSIFLHPYFLINSSLISLIMRRSTGWSVNINKSISPPRAVSSVREPNRKTLDPGILSRINWVRKFTRSGFKRTWRVCKKMNITKNLRDWSDFHWFFLTAKALRALRFIVRQLIFKIDILVYRYIGILVH